MKTLACVLLIGSAWLAGCASGIHAGGFVNVDADRSVIMGRTYERPPTTTLQSIFVGDGTEAAVEIHMAHLVCWRGPTSAASANNMPAPVGRRVGSVRVESRGLRGGSATLVESAITSPVDARTLYSYEGHVDGEAARGDPVRVILTDPDVTIDAHAPVALRWQLQCPSDPCPPITAGAPIMIGWTATAGVDWVEVSIRTNGPTGRSSVGPCELPASDGRVEIPPALVANATEIEVMLREETEAVVKQSGHSIHVLVRSRGAHFAFPVATGGPR